MFNDNRYYRLGKPTERVVSAFRDLESLERFLKILPEVNLVPVYEIIGQVMHDEGGPDGLTVSVIDYSLYSQ